MEVKINKEIRNYTVSMFFGLSLRQCIFSVLGISVAIAVFFGLRDRLIKPLHVAQACSNGYFEYACLIKRDLLHRPRYELASIKQKLTFSLYSNNYDLDNNSYYYGYSNLIFGIDACIALGKIYKQPIKSGQTSGFSRHLIMRWVKHYPPH